MPGSRGKNLRKGDLAEGLGLEILRQFAFIAPVPRPEDVGIDAVATLFRQDGPRLIAEDSFLVQVKAASERSIQYRDEQLDWYRSLTTPLFWLSVDLKTTTFELWSFIRATSHPNFRDRKSVAMYLDNCAFNINGDEMHVCLEKPILRWNSIEAIDIAFQQTAYEVLKEWIAFEMKCLSLRRLGISLSVEWEVNCRPQQSSGYCVVHHPSQTATKLEEIRPYIQMLSSLCWLNTDSNTKDQGQRI